MASKLRIIVVDDNDQVRLGLSTLLSAQADFEVIGQATNGRQAIDFVSSSRPELVLMDVGMPVMDGIEACQRIKEMFPDTKVIMLTSHDNDTDVFASLAAGANGYCLKDVDFDRLMTAIKSVAAGDCWLDSMIASKVVKLVPTQESGERVFQALSPREVEVLNLVVDGMTNKEIAEKLSISIDTVKSHIKHIMNKLAVGDRTQMAVKALRSGLV